MSKLYNSAAPSKSWLAFELNVLRRMKFTSVAIPFAGEPALGAYLKRWDARVSVNDLLESNQTKAVAQIQNNSITLNAAEVEAILDDAYVPRHRLYNPALRNWFNETDAWWFDNVRANAEKLQSPIAKAVALSIGMAVGDYVLSFDSQTLELRQPLSAVFRRVGNIFPAPADNRKPNVCTNRPVTDFLAETHSDLMFLRLPRPHNLTVRSALGWTAWREDWIRGNDDFWDALETAQLGKLGTHTETKNQYLRLVEDFLQRAAHLDRWAIAHAADNFISTDELVETVNRVRRVETIYTKDFSELTGTKAVILAA